MKARSKAANIIAYIVLSLIGILFAIPLLWLVLAAFDKTAAVSLVIPSEWTLENFREVVQDKTNQQSFANSIMTSVIQTVIVLIISIMAAYPLSRYALKSGQRITMLLLFLTAIPATAVMVPIYQIYISVNLVDSITGVILFMAATALPYAIWMTKNFLDSVPIELEEAAWIDGASMLKTTVHVIMPLMLPGIFTVATFTFIGSWGNFFVPFILLQSTEKYPAAVTIYRFFGDHGLVLYGQLAAYSILYILPVFVMYFCSQKYMSQGFTMGGAAKG